MHSGNDEYELGLVRKIHTKYTKKGQDTKKVRSISRLGLMIYCNYMMIQLLVISRS